MISWILKTKLPVSQFTVYHSWFTICLSYLIYLSNFFIFGNKWSHFTRGKDEMIHILRLHECIHSFILIYQWGQVLDLRFQAVDRMAMFQIRLTWNLDITLWKNFVTIEEDKDSNFLYGWCFWLFFPLLVCFLNGSLSLSKKKKKTPW